MNSIDHNQPEHTHENLRGAEATAKIRQLTTPGSNCFFCTSCPLGDNGGVRPMNIRQVDEQGNLWFLSASDSHLNQELNRDQRVKIFLQDSKNYEFLYLTGRATLSTDRQKIKELW